MASVAAPEPEATSKGIDYSKFSKIEDSDDEKTEFASKTATTSAPEQPHCHNCHKEVLKPLRCGVCKKVAYCTAQCQKDDWPYHKRTCKKPEEKKSAVEKPLAPPKPAKDKESKPKKEDKVEETEESLTWYRHREWKPTAEPKREFTPTPLTGEAAAAASQAEVTKPTAGSVWNAAGTWEDKDVTTVARRTLKEKLEGVPDIDVAGGALSVTEVADVEGDASKPVIRGKQRHIFDLSFKVSFAFKWMDASGQRKAEGSFLVNDFTNDTFTEGVLTAPVVELAFKDSGLLDGGRRQAVEHTLGTAVWPPSASSLAGRVAERMQAWARDYEQAS